MAVLTGLVGSLLCNRRSLLCNKGVSVSLRAELTRLVQRGLFSLNPGPMTLNVSDG
jgi:hypothetical protein